MYSQNVGYGDYYKWKKVWSANARSDPLIVTFIGDQVLPYWIQCIRCSKWREMGRYFALTKDLTEQFICTVSCDEPEDKVSLISSQPTRLCSYSKEPLFVGVVALRYMVLITECHNFHKHSQCPWTSTDCCFIY